jgi:uncharacterized RDD family membrane protein YckC
VAFVLDAVLLAILVKVLGLVELFAYQQVVGNVILDAAGETHRRIVALFSLAHGAAGILVPLLYFTLMEGGRRGASLGKRALGLRVASSGLAPAGFPRALLRTALKALSAAPFFLGFILAAFTPRKRALHDLLSGSVVVRRPPAGRDTE